MSRYIISVEAEGGTHYLQKCKPGHSFAGLAFYLNEESDPLDFVFVTSDLKEAARFDQVADASLCSTILFGLGEANEELIEDDASWTGQVVTQLYPKAKPVAVAAEGAQDGY